MNSKTLAIIIKARDEASSTLKGASDNVESTSSKMASAMKVAAAAAAAASVAIGVSAVKAAGNYQSSLSQLKQASGANSAEMARMSVLARELGQDTTLVGVTAADAAATMTELSKAGLSVHDTMQASKGVMALARAGQMQFADAAVLAASALNAFGLSGKDAEKVADALAAGANASQAELGDLGEGLQQSATVAKQFGLQLNETVTALALFANNGIKGSDAGTSLKTMLIALAKPSEAAATAMEEIGFEAYHANGEFVGLREMSQRLAESMKGLTKEQQQNTLATIFGTDAFRAAAVLSDNAGDSYDGMAKSIGKAGAATEAAKAQMGPYESAVEGLNNAMSELQLQLGVKLLPVATQLINFMTNNAIPAFGSLDTAINRVKSAIAPFVPIIAGVVAGLVSYGAAALVANAVMSIQSGLALATGTRYMILNGALVAVKTATIGQTVAQTALNVVMGANPIGLLAMAIGGLTAAFITSKVATDNSKFSNESLNQSMREGKTASELLKMAQDNLTGANLTAEGAKLAVLRAERNLTEAVRQYGAESLEAKEATYQLKLAQDNAKTAVDNATLSAKDHKTAQINNNSQISRTTGSVIGQSDALSTLGLRLDQINGRTVNYSVTGKFHDYATKEAATGTGVPYKRNYHGGPVSAGVPTLVGENPDGTLNRTSELFVPSTGGRIFSSKDLREALSGGSVGTKITINMLGPTSMNSQQDIETLAQRVASIINQSNEMGHYGAGI